MEFFAEAETWVGAGLLIFLGILVVAKVPGVLAKSHADLPPALVITAGYDPLLDEGRAYAERLKAAGGRVDYREYPDMVHGFILFGGVLDTANAALAHCCAALRDAFEKVTA